MRTVIYFDGGTVGDFQIPDDRYAEFTSGVPFDKQHDDDDLHKARRKLAAFLRGASEGAQAGPEEQLAACYVWNYFNTHPDDEKQIEGDIIIVDLQGDDETIEFASTEDVQLAPEN